jgi:hypothetical protein
MATDCSDSAVCGPLEPSSTNPAMATSLPKPVRRVHVRPMGSLCAWHFSSDSGNDRAQDVFSVVWDRSVDKDIGQNEPGLP